MKMSDNSTKYEVLIEQYLRSILDISDHSPTDSRNTGTELRTYKKSDWRSARPS